MKQLLFFFSMIWSTLANAQVDYLYTFNTPNQQIAKCAVEKGFVNVASSYRLQDMKNQKLYGRNGEDAFGITSSVGLKIEGGLILLDQAVHPWNYDDDYIKYHDKYNAVPYRVTFVDKEKSSSIYNLKTTPCHNNNLLFAIEDTIVAKGEGFTVDSSDGLKDGWIIWMAKDSVNDKSFHVFKKKIEFKPNITVYDVDQPNTFKKVIAGIFVEPTYVSVGTIKFNLCAIAVEQNNRWVLAKPSFSSVIKEANSIDSPLLFAEPDNTGIELTPIEEKIKPKKKNKKK